MVVLQNFSDTPSIAHLYFSDTCVSGWCFLSVCQAQEACSDISMGDLPPPSQPLLWSGWLVVVSGDGDPSDMCTHAYAHTHTHMHHTCFPNQGAHFILRFLFVNAVNAKLYIQLWLLSFLGGGKRQTCFIWTSVNNSHATFYKILKQQF